MVKPSAPSDSRLPFLPALVIVAAFIPEAFSIRVFDLRMTPMRVLLLTSSLYVLFSYGKMIASARYRFVISDVIMPVFLAWMVIAPAQTDGIDVGLKNGGVIFMEIGGCYAVMRSMLTSPKQLYPLIRLFVLCCAIAGLLALLDMITGRHLLREDLADLTGYHFFYEGTFSAATRYGLLRGQGPLEHPILLAIAMVYALMLSRMVSGGLRTFCWLGCGIGLFAALTSSAFQGLFIGIALVWYGRLIKFEHKWLTLTVGFSLSFAIFYVSMSNPFGWLFNHFLPDSGSAYYRLFTWQYVSDVVSHHPIFGWGFGDDWPRPLWMNPSIDSLWLRQALISGLPGLAFLFIFLFGAFSLPVRSRAGNANVIGPAERRLAETFGILFALTLFFGFSVYYWGSVWDMLGIFAGMRAFLGQVANEAPQGVAGATLVSQNRQGAIPASVKG